MKNDVIVAPEKFGVEKTKAKELTSGLDTILEERKSLIKNYKEVISLEISKETIPVFRELRLKIRDNRTKGINIWHKNTKEYFLAGGKFVDAIKNKEVSENEMMEEKLMNAEKHFENLEIEKLKELNEFRIKLVAPYVEEAENLNLSSMEEDVFEAYLSTKKSKFEAALAEEKRIKEEAAKEKVLDKLEQDRKYEIAPYSKYQDFNSEIPDLRTISQKEYSEYKKFLLNAKKEDDAKQEAIRLENEKLKKEADKRVKIESERIAKEKAKKEKQDKENERLRLIKEAEDKKIQDQLKKEREENERLRQEKIDEESEKLRLAKIEEKRLAELKKAPLKDKMKAWTESFSIPETDVENEVTKDIKKRFESFKNWAKEQTQTI